MALIPLGRGLVAHTLHEAKDVNDADLALACVPPAQPAAEMVALAAQLIVRQAAGFDPADMADRYEAGLREVIAAKVKGKTLKPEAAPTDNGKVVDLVAALKRSLAQGTAGVAKRPASRKWS